MRSKGILTMGTAFPRVPPRNDHWTVVPPNTTLLAMPLTLRLKSIRKVALLANIRYEYFSELFRVDIVLHTPNSYNKLTK